MHDLRRTECILLRLHRLLCVMLLLQWLPQLPPLYVAAHALARSARMRSAAPRGDAQFILPACMLLCVGSERAAADLFCQTLV